LTNWASLPISSSGRNISSAAVKTDGTFWVWGYNNDGMLGINQAAVNPFVSVSSPTQVGALNNWQQVSIGRFTMAALKTDGTLWTWGIGNNGRLGQNSTASKSSPVQVGSETYWGFAMAGEDSGAAIRKL
jgi:alpha-tubulin suppressor-like RCC1 family protein